MEQIKRSRFSLRRFGKQTWHYVLIEPFVWLFYCFFQPTQFKNEFEVQSFWNRVVPMLRLALPIFLLSYPFALVVQIILSISFSSRGRELNILGFLLTAAWIAAISVGWGTIGGIIGGIVGDIRLGIILGISFSIGGIAGNSTLGIKIGITEAITVGVLAGTVMR